jgi:hypothetical protein
MAVKLHQKDGKIEGEQQRKEQIDLKMEGQRTMKLIG